MMDEISENLKRTIKKYNDLDIENDLSVVQSQENEESKSNVMYNSNEKVDRGNLVYQTKKIIEVGLNNNNNLGEQNKAVGVSTQKNNISCNQQVSKILKSLDALEENMDKDFHEIEGIIENVIEKEIKNFYRLFCL